MLIGWQVLAAKRELIKPTGTAIIPLNWKLNLLLSHFEGNHCTDWGWPVPITKEKELLIHSRGEGAELHLSCSSSLSVTGIITGAPLPVRSMEPLDSQRDTNPTVNCICKGSQLWLPLRKLRCINDRNNVHNNVMCLNHPQTTFLFWQRKTVFHKTSHGVKKAGDHCLKTCHLWLYSVSKVMKNNINPGPAGLLIGKILEEWRCGSSYQVKTHTQLRSLLRATGIQKEQQEVTINPGYNQL